MGHSPEWEIEKNEFLRRIESSDIDFQNGLCLPSFQSIERVVPLRYLQNITDAPVPMSHKMLLKLISHIKTLDKQSPFEKFTIELSKLDPKQLKIGQKFVYRENYQSLLENLSGLFGRFAIPCGVADLGAYFIFGKDMDGLSAMACYTPPIIELHKSDLVIMDGIHRSYITKQLGSTISAIIVRGVSIPFPCGLHSWDDIQVISLTNKPKNINERYFALRKELFRDLKYFGIDG